MGYLRSLFGPSRDEIWKQLAESVHGRLVEGGLWHGDKIIATVDQWTVTLDTYTVSHGDEAGTATTYIRIRAPYVNRDGFRFELYRASIFTPLGKALGMQDVDIGDPQFDQAFVLKGTDEQKLLALLASERLRQLLLAQPEVHLLVKDDEGWFGATFPEGVDELYLSAPRLTDDLEALRSLYDLFAETLHQLSTIGSAYEKNPRVEL